MATGGRKTQIQAIHEISAQFGFGQVAGIVGVLPAGAIANMAHALVSQVWNGTTNGLTLGVTPGGAQVLATVDLKALGRTDTAVPVAGAAMGPYAVDTPIYGTITSTGPAPTTGVATVWIDYLPGPG